MNRCPGCADSRSMATALCCSPLGTDSIVPERRCHSRQRFEAKALLFNENTPDVPGMPVRVFDMSLAGIGFHSAQPLPLCSIHLIEIASPTLHVNSRLRITRCDRRTTGYDVGAEFIER